MRYLDEELIVYSKSEVYPFHMPGHKRQNIAFPNPYTIDITEIDGFDNLHHAEGILQEAQQRAATLYGSDHCFYLVNGSTCGLLAAISAATMKRDKILVARNCHKAVYHALFLKELDVEFLYPQITANDLQGQITVQQVEDALCEHPDITAVVITSPTYEGIISDVAGIAKVCHDKNIPLIVDEAHGAHLGFGGEAAGKEEISEVGSGFGKNAVRLGADAVVMSLHKTLPSFTQTALLHINGDRIKKERVKRYLGIYQTSSPSYLFMAGMDACVRMLEEQGEKLFSDYRRRLNHFYQSVADLKNLHVMTRKDLSVSESYDWDDSKLIIFTKIFTGEMLHQKLLRQYHLQMEMVSGNYVLGMTSIMDTDEGLNRLSAALHEIDVELEEVQRVQGESAKLEAVQRLQRESAELEEVQRVQGKSADFEKVQRVQGESADLEIGLAAGQETAAKYKKMNFTAHMYEKNPRRMQIYQAVELPEREVPFDEAAGEMSADYVFLYPPGIPLLVPGEVITREFIEKIRECQRRGLNVEGQSNLAQERIKIVYF